MTKPRTKPRMPPKPRPLTPEQRDLVAGNLGLAHHIADKMADLPLIARRLSRSERTSAAYLGLCLAARGYNPAIARFSTYATWTIRHVIMNAALEEGGVIRLPRWASGGKYPSVEFRASVGHAALAPSDLVQYEEYCDSSGEESELLALLPHDEREVIRLMYWEGLTRVEAGKRLGWTAGQTAAAVKRAIVTLRGKIEEREGAL
jgi:RNA polymerase sigma factor (sigma-70 family)